MHATLDTLTRIYATGEHAAFTDLCTWRGKYYVAFRRAYSHGIVPPGEIAILIWDGTQPKRPDWQFDASLRHPRGDCRDPKFFATPHALYLICGVYLPMPSSAMTATLSPLATDNLLITHITFTTDGEHWAPLQPILRPNYWGWSMVPTQTGALLASYHVGTNGECTSSIALWSSNHLLRWQSYGTIYDGASYTKDAQDYRYPSGQPSEPVLYIPDQQRLACCLRTENSMAIGISLAPHQDNWRWWNTKEMIHSSAILATEHSWLLSGRALTPVYANTTQRRTGRAATASPRGRMPDMPSFLGYQSTTALWTLNGQYVEPLLTFPSGGDTGYAGLCYGRKPGEYYCSYYSQHNYDANGIHQASLPSADIYVATIHVEE